MTKNISKIVLAAVCSLGGFAAVASTAGAASAVVKHPTYPLGTAKHCKAGYAKMTERHKVSVRVKVDGKLVTERVSRRYIACVYVGAKKIIVTSPTQIIPVTTVPVATATLTAVRALIDPAYTQNPANPLDVTFSYSANGSPLPNGVLSLYWGVSAQSQTLACSVNVGGATVGSTCEVIFPAFGPEVVTVQYVSGTSSATQTDAEDIENLAPVTTTTTTIPSPLQTTTTITCESLCSSGPPTYLLQVTDSNGTVLSDTQGLLTIQVSTNYAGGGQVPQWTVTASTTSSAQQADCTLTLINNGSLSGSAGCIVSGQQGIQNDSSDPLITLQAIFAGTSTDAPSSSSVIDFP